ncbi:CAAX prenyl protease-related protein [Duganella sp. CY15W]|uniref:CAAX prenyl protease-related protein n=1 Tax=Duganella sp. CY15W TaxID=2692172 RepID=UPI00136DC9E4|nr:CAAX prenyl protease-related protein [Duganella sp. CY15W]MYM32522.1 CAAX prenyl protease-related protein [Duganella sp. CY15W]
MFERAALARILPFGAYMLFIFIADMLARAGVPDSVLLWLYPLKIAVVALLLWVFWSHYEELRAPRLRWPDAVLALVAGVVVLLLWLWLDSGWMVMGQPGGYEPRVNGQLSWTLVAIRLAGASLVVPLMEELFWRSFLMRWITTPAFQGLSPHAINYKSFIVTVILFGVEHNLWLAGMVAGLAYGLLYARTGKLWVAILAHAVTNGLLGVWIIATASWTYW